MLTNLRQLLTITTFSAFMLQILCFLYLFQTHTTISSTAWTVYQATLLCALLIQFALHANSIFTGFSAYQIPTFSKPIIALIIIIILVGGIVRVQLLDAPIAVDEARTIIDFADPKSSSIAELTTNYGDNNNHPLNSGSIYLTASIVGASTPTVVRIPVFVGGVVLAVLVFLIGYLALNSLSIGTLAAFYVALTPHLILYSVRARGYIFITLFFTANTAIVWSLHKKSTPTKYFLLFLCSVLGMYSNLSMIYPLIVVLSWLFLAFALDEKFAELRGFLYVSLGIGAATILLYSPMFRADGVEVLDNQWTESLHLLLFLDQRKNNLREITSAIYYEMPILYLYVSLALATIGMYWEYRTYHRLPILLVMMLVLPIVLTIQRPWFVFARVYTFVVPLIGLYAAMGFAYLSQNRLRPLGGAILLFCGYMFVQTSFYNAETYIEQRVPDTEAAITYLMTDHDFGANDILAANSGENYVIKYYLLQKDYDTHSSVVDGEPQRANRIFIISTPDNVQNSFDDIDLPLDEEHVQLVDIHQFADNTIYEVTNFQEIPDN